MDDNDTMLGKALKKLVAVPGDALRTAYDLLEKLSGKEWKKWHEVFKLLSRLSPEKAIEALSAAKTLLTDLNIVMSVARKGRFVASKCFVVGKNSFWSFGTNFANLIKDYVEDEVEAVSVRLHELTESSRDDQILDASGGKEAIEITLGQLFHLLRNKPFNDGKVYFAYIKGLDFAVDLDWRSGYGWRFGANPVDDPHAWNAGIILVARDSSGS